MKQAFSAPGKALLAGGYLVLSPQYNSYVTALSSRMHAVIEGEFGGQEKSRILIRSPQFKDGEWEYWIDLGGFGFELEERGKGGRNPFIEATIATVLHYIAPKQNFDLEVVIYSDPGYHSQDGTVGKSSDGGEKRFLFHGRAINEVEKTGLGSSAGLVSVLTTAMLGFFQPHESVGGMRNIVHNCSQIAHCYAQKKIGSGFDVAAAVYGSIIYQRFQPSVIENLLSHPYLLSHDSSNAESVIDLKKSFMLQLSLVVDFHWEFTHTNCALPPHIKLLMGDVKGGSETPKLVSKVLQWKNENPNESNRVYRDLEAANLSLIKALSNLQMAHDADREIYNRCIQSLQNSRLSELKWSRQNQPGDLSALAPFVDLVSAIDHIRQHLRELTKLSGAEIEPPSQTQLLDNCSQLHGCFGGIVPGAGGFDAICLLVIESSVDAIIRQTSQDKNFASITWLDLHEESNGVIQEKPEHYSGL